MAKYATTATDVSLFAFSDVLYYAARIGGTQLELLHFKASMFPERAAITLRELLHLHACADEIFE